MHRRVMPFALAGLIALPAWAAGPLAITTSMLAEQTKAAADGTPRTALIAPTRVVPGQEVTLVVAYRNTGNVPLGDVVLANPVPRGMRYRGVPAGSAAPELSVDGTHYAATAASLRIALPDGSSRTATLADVTAVRWRLPAIPAGGAGQRAFRAALD